MDSGYYIRQDTGFLNGHDLASAVAQGLSKEEYYAKKHRKEEQDAGYQAHRVGHAEASVLRLELELERTKQELAKARGELRERKGNYETKFGSYKRDEDIAKYLRTIKARHMGVDAVEFDRVVSNHPDEQESLEELYGPAGA